MGVISRLKLVWRVLFGSLENASGVDPDIVLLDARPYKCLGELWVSHPVDGVDLAYIKKNGNLYEARILVTSYGKSYRLRPSEIHEIEPKVFVSPAECLRSVLHHLSNICSENMAFPVNEDRLTAVLTRGEM